LDSETRKSENVSGTVIEFVRDEDLAEEPVTRISTPSIYLLADFLHPLPLYKDERRQTDHRRAAGARNDRPRRTETAPRGTFARSGAVPPEKGIASEPQETNRLPEDLDFGVGADAGSWPSSQVLPNAQEHGLGPGEAGMDEPRDAYPTNPGSSIPARRISPEVQGGSGDHFAAPLGLSRSGHLRFTNGGHRIIIQADSRLRGLYRARFGDRMPKVEARRGIVTIQYPRFPGGDWLNDRSERPAEVELNASIPWDVEVSGGASRLLADLRGLRLGSLKVDGGASRLEVVLPAPSGIVNVVILGGASNIAIRRPEGAAAQLRVDGGATNLTFDARHIGVAGGELNLQSRDYGGTADRYAIAVTGGANNVNVERRPGTRDRGSEVSA
jgi:hypothetical protein